MNTASIKIGDVVALKSGSAPMTVQNVTLDVAIVVWYHEGATNSASIPVACLCETTVKKTPAKKAGAPK